MSIQRLPLADPENNKKYFKALSEAGASMETGINYHVVKFNSFQQELAVYNETFYFLHTEKRNLNPILSDFRECYEDETLTEQSENFDSFLDDYLDDATTNIKLKGLLIDTDSNKPLYLEKRHCTEKEYYIIGNMILFRVVVPFILRGDQYQDIFNNVDLSKFGKRHYYQDELMDYKTTNQTDLPTVFPSMNGDIIFTGETIDHRLLVAWMRYEFLKQIFPVKNNPFFERDGLIHFKTRGFGDIQPEYQLPSNLVHFHRSVRELKLSRKYNDQEYFVSNI